MLCIWLGCYFGYGSTAGNMVYAGDMGGAGFVQDCTTLYCLGCGMCCLNAGNALINSETVRKFGFTGSTAVGKMLAEQAAKVSSAMSCRWRCTTLQHLFHAGIA